jgi:hypothetical protein
MAALVLDVQAGHDPLEQHARGEPARRVRADPAVHQQSDAVWSTEVKVVADHLLETFPPATRAVEGRVWLTSIRSRERR